METETLTVDLGRLELRDADDGAHELDGVCVPYGVETRKAGPRPERFAAHAFAGVGAQTKIRLVDENHAWKGRRPVGVAKALNDESHGLVGRFRFYDTPEGRSAFENVRAGTYGGLSIGFVAVREAIVAGVREITEATLHHVSLVDEPAYDDAQIIAVRGAERPAWTLVQFDSLDTIEIPLLTPYVTR
jgi:HK97 family phage prohead protease